MPTYDTVVDEALEDNSHAYLVRLVGPGKRVLDVGCATGYLGEVLKRRGCEVVGVDIDQAAVEKAAHVLDAVHVVDLEQADLLETFGPASFDVIVFGDVLEHLRDPLRLLRSSVGLLRPGGSVVVSVPNVAHGSIRLSLLQGGWEYQDRGLLDRTHVTFFTRVTLLRLLSDAGLAVIDLWPTHADALATEIPVDTTALPDGALEWVRRQPDADVYQFVLRAVLDDRDGAVARLRSQVDALVLERDSARAEADRTRDLLKAEHRSVAEAQRRAEHAETEVEALYATRAMRALRAPRRLYGRLRRPS
ncbi:class I SAM-dependent methyltransferase [Cellulomonas sp. S1-8]|uniref:class I SAM-dependent methyltransferase n=1 Tax=Cellulomonas sp. S1-8 TaxID=2904790 RepID=UPI002243FFBB|nr:class I SAM-dependent methyltransferase [Cellulomonas sp. S1-8]UZN01940.1 class I SAM-dependent methyltransferase [Cellulomonas sp. S1-8]